MFRDYNNKNDEKKLILLGKHIKIKEKKLIINLIII